jgi:hypothetical protein
MKGGEYLSKIKKLMVSIIGIGLILLAGYFLKRQELISAAIEPGYTDIAPKIHLEDNSSGASVEIPGQYGFMFKLTDNVTYEGINETNRIDGIRGSNSSGYQFNPSDNGKYSERGVWIRNAGLYNGRSVDLKMVVDDLSFKELEGKPGEYPNFNFIAVNPVDKDLESNKPASGLKNWGDVYLMVGSTAFGETNDKYHVGDTIDYHYEFYDHETQNKLMLPGSWNFNNINRLKAVSIPYIDDFDNMYGLSETPGENYSGIDIGYKIENGYLEMYGGNAQVNKKSGMLTHLFNAEKYAVKMERRYSGTTEPPANNTGNMGVLYSTQSLVRIAPAAPMVIGEKNNATHTDAGYQELRYSILQNIADNTKINRDSSFVIETEVPNYYSIESVKVFEYGNYASADEYTDIFTITKDSNNPSKVTIKAKDPTADPTTENPKVFNGHLFDIQVIAKPNSLFDFNPQEYHYRSDGYMEFENGADELQTAKTKSTYEYKDPSGSTRFKNTLKADITDKSMSEVLYEGKPTAKAKTGIKIPLNTDILAEHPFDSNPAPSVTENFFLEQISVDTDNSIDKPVKVSYSSKHPLPDTTQLGEKSLWLTLTTAKNVTQEIEVKIEVVPISAELRVKYKINGAYMSAKYPDYVDVTQMSGSAIDLKKIKQVTDTLQAIKDAGYEQINTPIEEFTLSANGNIVEYEFKGLLFLSSSPTILDFGIEEASYQSIRVNEAKLDKNLIIKDTRASKQKWTLFAKVTQEFTLTANDGSQKVIPDILRYNDGTPVEKRFDLNQSQALLVDTHTSNEEYNVSHTWTKNGKGFKLAVPGDSVKKIGKYQAKIEFTVSETP